MSEDGKLLLGLLVLMTFSALGRSLWAHSLFCGEAALLVLLLLDMAGRNK